MKTECTFKKFDAAKQIVYGVVYSPMMSDSQGDWATAETIEKMAHDFSAKSRAGAIDVEHDRRRCGAAVVESFIARKGDQDFAEGAWAMGIKTPDDIWALVKSGKITGLSMYGHCQRVKKELPGQSAGKNELINAKILSVSLVSRAATREEFVMTKSDNSIEALAEQFTAIAAQIQQATETIKTGFAAQQAQLDQLAKSPDGRIVKTQVTVNPYADEIDAEHRMHTRLEDRLWSIMERPDQFPDDAEAKLRSQIVKSEDRLFSLGYNPQRTELDSNCAFFERGGTSNFLQGGISNLDDILGISRNTRALEKSADEINLCKIYI